MLLCVAKTCIAAEEKIKTQNLKFNTQHQWNSSLL